MSFRIAINRNQYAAKPSICFWLNVALMELKPTSNDSFLIVDATIWWDFTVRVWRRPPVVDLLLLQNLGPNMISETLELFTSSVRTVVAFENTTYNM